MDLLSFIQIDDPTKVHGSANACWSHANAEVRGGPISTLLFVTSPVSATPERENEGHTESVNGFNLRTISAPQRTDPAMGDFADLSGSDFLIGGIRTIISPDMDRQKVCVPQWSVTNGSRLEDGHVFREMVDEFAPPKFFAEKRILKSVVEEKNTLLKVRKKEIGDLRAQLLLKEAEAVKAICLRVKASQFEVVEKSLRDEVQALTDRNAILEKEKGELNVKAADLAASVKVMEQEVADLDDVVTSVKIQNDNLADQVHKLETSSAILQEKVKAYENYMTAIGKVVEKGMQDGLSTGITHGAEGRALTDVAAYNPSAEADYLSALQHLQSPHVDQLMVPIHHSLDQRAVGASALSLSLDVSSSRVRRIQENIVNHRSALHDVFVPLKDEPLFVTDLTGTKSTLNVIPATVDTTTAMSVASVSASLIPSISTDDYEIAHAEGGESASADVNPFPNVDDAELNTS
nr:hypothetical protein [Tanacetum cinerariifolium]